MKRIFLLLAVMVGLCSCHDSGKHSPANLTVRPSTEATPKSVSNNKPFPFDTIKKESSYIVLGDSSELPNADNVFVSLKFKPYIHFTDLPASILPSTTRAPIQYSTHKWARQFRTVITETYNKEGLNFGGHYCFAYWRCGSDCQASVLVDVMTGIVYEGPDAGRGYAFKKNSRLLIANPPDSSGYYTSIEPRVYIWNEAQKQFEQRE